MVFPFRKSIPEDDPLQGPVVTSFAKQGIKKCQPRHDNKVAIAEQSAAGQPSTTAWLLSGFKIAW